MSDDKQFMNPYLAASMLPPGRERLDAVRQFLDEEQHRLNERLSEMEAGDGSIPDEVAEEWAMVKGQLDQTRLFRGLVLQGVLTDELAQETDNAE